MSLLPELWHGKPSRAGASRTEQRGAELVRRLVEHPVAPDLKLGRPTAEMIPVVICFWHRPERIEAVLDMIEAQRSSRRVRLLVWNNETDNTSALREAIAQRTPKGALGSVELYASPENVGGIGRFIAANYLWTSGARGPFIMIDDDEDFGSDVVESFVRSWTHHSLLSWWAFATDGSYWNRSEIASGDRADYAGTGGSIIDLEIASAPSFFEIPARFLFLEDLWMDHWAKLHGWRIEKLDVDIRQVMEYESSNQYHQLRDKKNDFDAFLRAREAVSTSR